MQILRDLLKVALQKKYQLQFNFPRIMWQKEKRNVVAVGVLKDVFQPFNVLSKNFQNSLVDAPLQKVLCICVRKNGTCRIHKNVL